MKRIIKKAFVLGGTGFLGKYIVEELIKDDIEIQCLINKTPLHLNSPKVKSIFSPITQFNWKSLDQDLPDIIIHAARLSASNKKDRQEVAQHNAIANQRLINWLETVHNPPLLIFTSGTLVYGSHGNKLINENTTPEPISFQREYFEAEKPILNAGKEKKLPIIIVRPAWIYGMGSWLQTFYLKPAQKSGKLPLYGNGKNYMNFIHVKDCAGMIKHLASYGEAGKIYNLFSHEAIRQKDFVKMLSKQMKKPTKTIPLWWLKLRYEKAVYEAFNFSLNLDTLHKETFADYAYYFPDLEDGLKDAIES